MVEGAVGPNRPRCVFNRVQYNLIRDYSERMDTSKPDQKMTKEHLITGRIIPERKSFGHEGLRLYVEEPDKGIDICLLFGVSDNQLIAKVRGEIGKQSNAALKHMVTQAEEIVLNAIAFTTGTVFEVDVIGVIRDRDDRADGSFDFHYLDNVHDIIAERSPSFDFKQIWVLCISEDGLPLRRCLKDLRSALMEVDDSPFYCYRAIETIKGHIGDRFGETRDKKQWEVMRKVLGLNRADLQVLKDLADPLRHGRPLNYYGSQWREIVTITWNVADAYIRFLLEVAKGERKWPDGVT